MAKANKYSEGYTTTYIPEEIRKRLNLRNNITSEKSEMRDALPKKNISKICDVSTSYIPAQNYLDGDSKEQDKRM